MASVKEFIADLLYQDSILATAGSLGVLLEYNAVTKPNCVFFRNPPAKPILPVLTYWVSGETNAEKGYVDLFFMFTAFGDNFTAVIDRVYSLLDRKNPLTATDYSLKKLAYDGNPSGEMFDDDLKAYWKQVRYRVKAVKL